jgi:hypothetical protein
MQKRFQIIALVLFFVCSLATFGVVLNIVSAQIIINESSILVSQFGDSNLQMMQGVFVVDYLVVGVEFLRYRDHINLRNS